MNTAPPPPQLRRALGFVPGPTLDYRPDDRQPTWHCPVCAKLLGTETNPPSTDQVDEHRCDEPAREDLEVRAEGYFGLWGLNRERIDDHER